MDILNQNGYQVCQAGQNGTQSPFRTAEIFQSTRALEFGNTAFSLYPPSKLELPHLRRTVLNHRKRPSLDIGKAAQRERLFHKLSSKRYGWATLGNLAASRPRETGIPKFPVGHSSLEVSPSSGSSSSGSSSSSYQWTPMFSSLYSRNGQPKRSSHLNSSQSGP